jgi:pimeloyl-ACP methyl ester carboxylesterase
MKKHHTFLLFIVILLIAFSACGLGVKKIPPGTIVPRTPNDFYIKIGDVNLHYREYPGAGPDIVMQHGFASSTYSWEKIAPALSAKGYHLWALDLKGSGWSDKPSKADYSPLVLKEELNAFMEAKGLKNVIFIGNSLGGAIAVLMAIDHPDKIGKLILIDAAGYPMKKPGSVTFAALHGSAFFGSIFLSRSMVKSNLGDVFYKKERLTEETIDAYYDRLRTENGLLALELLARSLDFTIFDQYKTRIPLIDKETLIIWGKEDRWIPVKNGYRYRKSLQNSKLIVLPECGHAPQEELPNETSRYILDFLEGKPVPESPVPMEIEVE